MPAIGLGLTGDDQHRDRANICIAYRSTSIGRICGQGETVREIRVWEGHNRILVLGLAGVACQIRHQPNSVGYLPSAEGEVVVVEVSLVPYNPQH